MQSEGCSDWKIDPKDVKICRNCKKPKSDHIINKPSIPSEKKPEEKPEKPQVNIKSTFSGGGSADKTSPLKSPNKLIVEKDKEKDMKSPALTPTKLSAKKAIDKEKDLKSPGLPPKVLEKNKDMKSPLGITEKKPGERANTEIRLTQSVKPGVTKPINAEKKSPEPLSKFKTEELHKKAVKFTKEEKKCQTPPSDPCSEEEFKNGSIVKNQDFKNKLDNLFKKGGGNPMRMNDDCRGYTKKKSIAPATLANGKRASKTFEDMFDIQTTVDVSREDIKKNLTKLIGMRMAGMDGLPAIPEMKAEKGKEMREEMIKNMNDDILDRPQIAKKTKAMKKTGGNAMEFME